MARFVSDGCPRGSRVAVAMLAVALAGAPDARARYVADCSFAALD